MNNKRSLSTENNLVCILGPLLWKLRWATIPQIISKLRMIIFKISEEPVE